MGKKNVVSIKAEVPDFILTHEADEYIRYDEGVKVPQTSFSLWGNVKYAVEAALFQFEHPTITIGTISYDDMQAMRGIYAICRSFQRADYAKSKQALIQWLKEEGITVTSDMLEKPGNLSRLD